MNRNSVERGQKWVAKNNADEVVTIAQVGIKGVSFTYDSGKPSGESLMVVTGFTKHFRKV